MKKLTFVIIFILASVLLYADSQIIEYFRAINNNSNDNVNIEWKTVIEKNIYSFEIQRLSNSIFKTIHFQPAKGEPTTYKFTDSDSFTKDNLQAQNAASYRIKINYSDHSSATYTNEVNVTRNVSSIKRTLGMLKEMFK